MMRSHEDHVMSENEMLGKFALLGHLILCLVISTYLIVIAVSLRKPFFYELQGLLEVAPLDRIPDQSLLTLPDLIRHFSHPVAPRTATL